MKRSKSQLKYKSKQLSLNRCRRNRKNFNKKEECLSADNKKLNSKYELAQRMLKSAEKDLDIAIEKGDMMSVKVAREMIS